MKLIQIPSSVTFPKTQQFLNSRSGYPNSSLARKNSKISDVLFEILVIEVVIYSMVTVILLFKVILLRSNVLKWSYYSMFTL